jgi:DNA repair ATPase RecN
LQVAAHAATHVRVAKGTEVEGRVTTRFQHLSSFSERSEEVAAMMGMEVALAEDMLHQASLI